MYLSDFLKNSSTYIARDNLGELHGTFNYLVQRHSGDVFEELPKRTPEEKWMIKITYGRRTVESKIHLIYPKNTYLGKETLSVFSDGNRQDITFNEILINFLTMALSTVKV